MSYSHNKYRQREYRQRDRQFQCHSFYCKTKSNRRNRTRHDERKYKHYNCNRNDGIAKRHRQDQNRPPPQGRAYNYDLNYSEPLYYDRHEHYSYAPRNGNGNGYANGYDNGYANGYANGSNYQFQSEDRFAYESDAAEDEDEDDDLSSVPPLSPLSLKESHGGQRNLYIKKNTSLHAIYLFHKKEKEREKAGNGNARDKTQKLNVLKIKNIIWRSRLAHRDSAIQSISMRRNGKILQIGHELDAHAPHAHAHMPNYRVISSISDIANGATGASNGDVFDLVNISFAALHSAFESELTLRALVDGIRKHTHSGSLLSCCFVRDEVILSRLGVLSITNSILNIMSTHEQRDGEEQMRAQNGFQSLSMKRKHFDSISQQSTSQLPPLFGIPFVYSEVHCAPHLLYFVRFGHLTQILSNAAQCKMKLLHQHNASQVNCHGKCDGNDDKTVSMPCTEEEREVIDTFAFALFQRL